MPNRIAKTAAGSELLFFAAAEIPAAAWDYYENMAKGGVGMIWVEAGDITPDASLFGKPVAREEDIAYWQPFVEALHSHGAFVGTQIEGDFFTSSSTKTIPSPLDQNSATSEMLTTEGVHEFQQRFINAAANIQKMGFDGVELNCSCSHTFDLFLSRFWNVERDDEYGGSPLRTAPAS